MLLALIHITILDILDILIVAYLMFQLYKLIKGTAAIKIFFGIALIYMLWLLVKALKMELLGAIMGQVIGVGVIALLVVFQQEVRQFLLMLGDRYIKHSSRGLLGNAKLQNGFTVANIEKIVQAAIEMAETKTGALIVISREASLKAVAQTGEYIDSDINVQLIKAIFYKNAPLHDGALLVENNRLTSAKCILPVSANPNLPNEYGLRHRSGLGMSESSDTLVLIVSEQSGSISIAQGGKIFKISGKEKITKAIFNFMRRKKNIETSTSNKQTSPTESQTTI